MNLNVTQQNLYLFLPAKISWLADALATENNISVADAIKTIYASDTYRRLEQESTKMWHLGPTALLEDLHGIGQ